ncbi:MAG: COX15/CtaA family protein [Francisellaceae bacterium]|jgi:heme a synthase|nr:COX15/CtaA family protein [Francisellaceae bacterium]MBT6207367.1 COX15/CtaA family protein [Francisellaceae bacterium]MBT6538237.1 COX15/CtaA family protein [Francisellaceae bacterium]
MDKKILHLSRFGAVFAFIVIIVGAYTRLTDAGLGCPDWPGCYGNWKVPSTGQELGTANGLYPGVQIESAKAWTEMFHRYIAGTLGLVIFAISCLLIKQRSYLFGISLSALVIFQAILGMWTVTLGLYPLAVMGHLLGGLTLFSLLAWLGISKSHKAINIPLSLNVIAKISILILFIQIFLGGWTSANYAALVCADFPTCQGQWWPKMDWALAFSFTDVGIFNSPGTALENPARITIQVAHRIGALITTITLLTLSYHAFRTQEKNMRIFSVATLLLLILQVSLGISNVLAGLPLHVALAHNGVAVLLLLMVILINKRCSYVPSKI